MECAVFFFFFFYWKFIIIFVSSRRLNKSKKPNISWYVQTRSHGKRVRISKHIFTGKNNVREKRNDIAQTQFASEWQISNDCRTKTIES